MEQLFRAGGSKSPQGLLAAILRLMPCGQYAFWLKVVIDCRKPQVLIVQADQYQFACN
jgi:hypothetical protein